jgi:hypothetical protein
VRVVHETAPGVVELNWMWLPTWLGQNTQFKREVEEHVGEWMKEHGPIKLDEDGLDLLQGLIMNFIQEKFPKEPSGLMKYLEGLAHVQYGQEG